MSEKKCKTCEFLAVRPDKAGRIVVRSSLVYQCAFPLPEEPVLPECITRNCGYPGWERLLHRRWMTGDDGTDCPCWEARKKAKDVKQEA